MKYWTLIAVATWGGAVLFLGISVFMNLYREALKARQEMRDDLIAQLTERKWSLIWSHYSKYWFVLSNPDESPLAHHRRWEIAIQEALAATRSPEPSERYTSEDATKKEVG